MPSRCGVFTLLSLLIVFGGQSFGASPSVRSISVEGNRVFSQREIIGWCSSKEGLTFSASILESDRQRILQQYVAGGFFDASVACSVTFENDDSSAISITIEISEGTKATIGTISVAGVTRFSEADLLEGFATQPGNVLDQHELELDIDNLLSRYERAGYPFVECRIGNILTRNDADNKQIDILLTVNEGRLVTIDEIRVEGNTETSASVVVRETRLTNGELFNPAKVEAIKPRLLRLNIFSEVSEPELYLRNDKAGLLIKVREGSTNTFDGVIGYVPAVTEGESGFITGLVAVSMRNLFGTGRKFSLRWNREDRFSQELGLRYLEPWVGGVPVNLGGGFIQRKQDTTYVRRAYDLRGELMLTEELTVAGLFFGENVIPSDTTYSRVFKSSTVSYGVEIQYDTRNDYANPTAGVRYRTDYHYGRKTITDIPEVYATQVKDKTTVQRITLDLDFFLSTFSRQVLALGLHGRDLQTDQPEESQMFRFGGARTLRGYRENQFIGTRIVWSNTEYRFLLARRSFLYGFVDTGYYFRPEDVLRGVEKSDDFKYGYGMGIQLETGLGIMGVSFALGEGDSFSQGKVHFGLVNEF